MAEGLTARGGPARRDPAVCGPLKWWQATPYCLSMFNIYSKVRAAHGALAPVCKVQPIHV